MDEAAWLACSDLERMLRFLNGQGRERALRLFACGCVRRVWYSLPDEHSRKAVESAERRADDAGAESDLAEARERLTNWLDESFPNWRTASYLGEYLSALKAALASSHPSAFRAALEAAKHVAASAAHRAAPLPSRSGRSLAKSTRQEQQRDSCRLLHELVGNPFRQPALAPSWLKRGYGTVEKLAQTIYAERAFDRLPILADALEEAGCTDPAILAHCRQPGEHVRGCWVVDLLLGKE